MASQILAIEFDAKTKKFIHVRGKKIETFHSDYVSADKWICRIRPDGSLNCKASETRGNKYYEIDFSISEKCMIRCTKLANGIRKEVLACKIWNWPVSGIIWLTGGPVEERIGFFKIQNEDNK